MSKRKERLTAAQVARQQLLERAQSLSESHGQVQLVDREGNNSGPPLDISLGTRLDQLNAVVNELLSNDEKLPYLFTVDNTEITKTLAHTVAELRLSTEATIKVVYQPAANFRVKAVTRCSSALGGHAKPVIAVRFSPDSEVLASGSGDTHVRLWDIHTETAKKTCEGHRAEVMVIAWAPDGRRLASGSQDRTVRLWSAAGDKIATELKGHRDVVVDLAWQPLHRNAACNRLASASRDGTVKIWEVSGGGGGVAAVAPESPGQASAGAAEPAAKRQAVEKPADPSAPTVFVPTGLSLKAMKKLKKKQAKQNFGKGGKVCHPLAKELVAAVSMAPCDFHCYIASLVGARYVWCARCQDTRLVSRACGGEARAFSTAPLAIALLR
jgi:WD40 repeat protein